MSLVAALLATREREIQNPRDEANRVAGRKAKLTLARELGGEEHIPLAIEPAPTPRGRLSSRVCRFSGALA